MSNRYNEVIDYINNTPKFTKKTKLSNTLGLLHKLGDPQVGVKTVHIAGTNGKGSVARMMSGFLQNSGFKTGLFTSPHLVRMNERIQINGQEISDDDLVDLFDKIDKCLDLKRLMRRQDQQFMSNCRDSGNINVLELDLQHPAFFELLFIMAVLYFKDKGCDYVVYETGLGGRLDATNILTPEISIITSIGMDHMQYLGDTIESIAGEKAGIIKKGIPVVYNTGDSRADKVIEEKAEELGSPCYNVSAAMLQDASQGSVQQTKDSGYGYNYKVSVDLGSYPAMRVLYQRENARTAISAFELMNIGTDIEAAIHKTLDTFSWPGRMEYIKPNVLIDGAHNEDAVLKYVESVKVIKERDGWDKLSLIFAVASDKDYDSMIKILTEELDFENVYIGEIKGDRKSDARTEVQMFRKYMKKDKIFKVRALGDISKAWETARSEQADDTLLLVVGSLYMVGEIKAVISSDNS